MKDWSSIFLTEVLVRIIAELLQPLFEELGDCLKPIPSDAESAVSALPTSLLFLFDPVKLELYKLELLGDSSRNVVSI